MYVYVCIWYVYGMYMVCICMYMYVYVCICMYVPTGWKPNQRFACFYVFHGVNGVGWGGVITFICTAWHTWCYAAVHLFALPHMHDATLLYVFLHVLTYMMLSCCTSSCTSSHTWCNATVCRLALPHIYDATLVCVSLAQWQDLDACSRLAVEMGKQFPQKPLQAHCRNCEEHLAQKKESAAEVFYISSEKYARTF